MKKLTSVMMVAAVAMSAASASAGERSFFRPSFDRMRTASRLLRPSILVGQTSALPTPADGVSLQEPAPMPVTDAMPLQMGAMDPMGLFPCVEYDDLDNVHPCAIKKIVQVIDPCYDRDSCCPPTYVSVMICVPPCGCEKVKISRGGRKVKYDYGKYEVEIKSKNGVVKVDYDD